MIFCHECNMCLSSVRVRTNFMLRKKLKFQKDRLPVSHKADGDAVISGSL